MIQIDKELGGIGLLQIVWIWLAFWLRWRPDFTSFTPSMVRLFDSVLWCAQIPFSFEVDRYDGQPGQTTV
jgi:hypothetical protein